MRQCQDEMERCERGTTDRRNDLKRLQNRLHQRQTVKAKLGVKRDEVSEEAIVLVVDYSSLFGTLILGYVPFFGDTGTSRSLTG